MLIFVGKSTGHQVMKTRNKLTFNAEIYNMYFMLPTVTEKSVVVKLLRAEYERRSKLMPLGLTPSSYPLKMSTRD